MINGGFALAMLAQTSSMIRFFVTIFHLASFLFWLQALVLLLDWVTRWQALDPRWLELPQFAWLPQGPFGSGPGAAMEVHQGRFVYFPDLGRRRF